jgi:hypothetical protein
LKAKTSYYCYCIKLIVKRLEAEHKKFDIGIKAELEVEQKEAERKEVEQKEAERKEVESNIKITGKLDITVEIISIKSKLEVEDFL